MALTRVASIVAAALTGLTIIPALVFTFLSFRLRTFRRDPTKPWVFFLRAALVAYSIWTILYTTARGYEIDQLENRDPEIDWQRNIFLTAPVLSHTATWILIIAQSLLFCTLWELLFAIQVPQAGGHTSRPRFAVHIFTAIFVILAIAQYALAVDSDRAVYDDATSGPFSVPRQGRGGSNRITANRLLIAIAALILFGVVGQVIASAFACARRGRGKYLRRSPVFALIGGVLFAIVLSWDIARAALWLVLDRAITNRSFPVWEPILTAVVRWIMLGVLIMLCVLAKERDSELWSARRGPKGEMVVEPALPECARAGSGEGGSEHGREAI
ncbi:hypothetical protein ACHAQH_005672 [Verticillium albo-atrum]